MRAVFTALIAFCSLGALAQPPAELRAGMPGGTATRSAAHYADLERGLLQALQDHDQGAAEQALADDFEVREAAASEALARADWLQDWMGGKLKSFRVRELSVHEFGDVAAVAFLLDCSGSIGGARLPRTSYVVDIWRQADAKLLVRYVSQPSKTVPAAVGPQRRE